MVTSAGQSTPHLSNSLNMPPLFVCQLEEVCRPCGLWRGRTEPNVGSLLGCQADILQLDVTDVINKGEIR